MLPLYCKNSSNTSFMKLSIPTFKSCYSISLLCTKTSPSALNKQLNDIDTFPHNPLKSTNSPSISSQTPPPPINPPFLIFITIRISIRFLKLPSSFKRTIKRDKSFYIDMQKFFQTRQCSCSQSVRTAHQKTKNSPGVAGEKTGRCMYTVERAF